MEKLITMENLRNFAYVNDRICKKPIRGVVLNFFGLGCQAMYHEETEDGKFYAEQGILYVTPYTNPWAWMNRQSVDYTDEILDVLFAAYGLGEDTPVVSSGGSMGGMAALIYTKNAKRTPVACVVNCPVCDTVFHFTERVDLPRTLYSALWYEDGSLDQALRAASPLHLAAEMPKVSYHLFHCDADTAVNIHSHSEKFVEAMRAAGQSITFDIAPGREHCDLTEELTAKYKQYCAEAVLAR
ncbi:MAG: prolyl oligopeptidase family serine peptidase [Clostridia bacterium]|nr:prolyl oligopeptidase family serine peptidase [Clostridia bacterium]